jgi:epoxyqueuosine reductase
MSETAPSMEQHIRKLAVDCGYADCGITTAAPFPEYVREVNSHMERFPETRPLYEKMVNRANPAANTPWAASIIVCIQHFGRYRMPAGLDRHFGKHYLTDRRCVLNPSFSMAARFKAGLKALGLRVKKGGAPDRWAAARAGVARIGRNNFAYSPRFGSWITIEPWLVNVELTPDKPTLDCPCPPDCRACLNACPTKAIAEPFFMRMDHCIAYLTFEAKEPLDPALEARMGSWIYGCDVCQNVCPLNAGKWEEIESMPWLEMAAPHLTPEAIANMDQETYEKIILPLFWYIPKEDRARWLSNARRALQSAQPSSP